MAKLTPEEKLKRVRADLFTKISRVFDDCIISNMGYIIPKGDTSYGDAFQQLAILKEGYVDMVTPEFQNGVKYISIHNVKDMKNDGVEGWTGIIPIHEDKKLIEKIDDNMNKIEKSAFTDINWQPLKLTEEELSSMYDNNGSVVLPGIQTAEGKSVIITKNLFPYTNKDNVLSLTSISMSQEEYPLGDLFFMNVRIDTLYFTLYLVYYFI